MKERINKLDLIKIKKICSAMDTVKENEKTSQILGEYVCKRYI